MDLESVKNYLKVDNDEDNQLILDIIAAAKAYLLFATGIEYHEENENQSLEKTFLQQLISDMYENRKPSVRQDAGFIWQSIILQLQMKGTTNAEV